VGLRRGTAVTVSALLVALVAAGCRGGGAAKAGGSSAKGSQPLVLSLLTGDSAWAPEYAAAVERLSHETMRIDVSVLGNRPTYELSTIRAVRSGRADLGAVGARAWDAFGVTSFRALIAPFLVRSLALEQRVLESPLAGRMLAGAHSAGVVGLALLPGPLRRPLGLSRPLVVPSNYRGATIAIRLGGVARATFSALGARSKSYPVGHLPTVDGAELDLNTIAENGYDGSARALTANVVYWPRPQTIFASRATFGRLTPVQQHVLRAAGGAALAPELARVAKDEAVGLAGVCSGGSVSLPSSSASQLAALRRAVQPVYTALERDPFTRRAIAAISSLRDARTTATDSVSCPRYASDLSLAARLHGEWQAAASTADLLAAGAPPQEAERQRGESTLVLRGGRWIGREGHSGFVWSGRYRVQGNVLRLIANGCPRALPCPRGGIAAFTWSLYEDRLSLALLSGTPGYIGLFAMPLTRVD